MNLKYYTGLFLFSIIIGVYATSCKKFIDPGNPETGLITATVFESDATANAAVLGGYHTILTSGFAQDYNGISAIAGLYTDELISYTPGTSNREVYTNSLVSISSYSRTIWQNIYGTLYQANSALEGLLASTQLTPATKDRLLAEAYFIRAFLFFHLVNLYGEVPLILSTDYELTRLQPRSTTDEVYTQIFADLDSAEALAVEEYVGGDGSVSSERIRANKSVIEAFKARVHLYRKDFAAAELYASRVINKNDIFLLEPDLAQTFLASSREAVWQLKPANEGYTADGFNFIFDGAPTTGVQKSTALSPNVVHLFSDQDQRKIIWARENVVDDTSYLHPYKYKSSFESPGVPEYLMVLRLAELYLIRAEARAEQGNLAGPDGAVSDLNMIRSRAGIEEPFVTDSYADVIDLIEEERQRELFTEWGHRFYDLKRWKGKLDPNKSRIDEVMPAVSTSKGGNWEPYEKLFPIPQTERTKSPTLTQNEGYN